jgi:hypothetical protein
MPGALKNKAIGVLLTVLAVYFLITDPVGSAHAVKTVVHGVVAFLGALSG